MRFLRRIHRPSPALAISCLALFVALGGTSFAAVALTKNSVRSQHIKNGQVKRVDLGTNAVTSAKVLDASLLAQDFAQGQLPAGPKGDTGAAGPVIAESTSGNVSTVLGAGSTEVASVTVAPAQAAHVMVVASVDAVGDGGNDDELFCYINDGTGAGSADDIGQRQSVGLPAVEGGVDDNEATLTVVAGEDRPAGSRTVKLFCGRNNGTVSLDSYNMVVWVGAG
ncbi:MAG: hypothetical protein WEA81_07610 [Dehalococcoidia bacterium]